MAYNMNELSARNVNATKSPGLKINNTFVGYRYNLFKEEIENFEVNDSDVWVCTFPKSGTTWVQEMVWLLVNNFDYEGAKISLDIRFPFFEFDTLIDYKKLEKVQNISLPECSRGSINYIKTLQTQPRCIKSHLPYYFLPAAIRNKEKLPKIIYVLRNPKDVCVSYYHHYKLMFSYSDSIEHFTMLFLHDMVYFAPYWKHIETYWQQKDEPNVLILKYEDLKNDLKSQALKVAGFLNKTIPENEMEKFLNHLTFDSMKQNHATNLTKTRKCLTGGKGDFMRKGVIGDHLNVMTPEMIETFDKWILENNKYEITF